MSLSVVQIHSLLHTMHNFSRPDARGRVRKLYPMYDHDYNELRKVVRVKVDHTIKDVLGNPMIHMLPLPETFEAIRTHFGFEDTKEQHNPEF